MKKLGCVLIVLGLASCDRVPGTAEYNIKEAETMIASQLKDPSSAQFRDVVVRGPVVCGEVNAKNAYGGYVGFKMFVRTKDAAYIDPELDAKDMNSMSKEELTQLHDALLAIRKYCVS